MNWTNILEAVLTLLGGGAIATLVTLRYQRASAAENVRKLKQENDREAAHILLEDIVRPLREDLQRERESRIFSEKTQKTLINEVRKLRKALEKISDCPFDLDKCPVRKQLQDDAAAGGDEPNNHPD